MCRWFVSWHCVLQGISCQGILHPTLQSRCWCHPPRSTTGQREGVVTSLTRWHNLCVLNYTGREDLLSRLGRISHVQRYDVRLPQCGAVVPRVSMWVVEITSFWRKIFEEHHEFRRLLFSLHPHHTVHIQKLLLCSYGLTMLNQEFWNTRCSWQSKNFRSVFSEGLLHFVILGESIKSRIVKSLIEVYITRKF